MSIRLQAPQHMLMAYRQAGWSHEALKFVPPSRQAGDSELPLVSMHVSMERNIKKGYCTICEPLSPFITALGEELITEGCASQPETHNRDNGQISETSSSVKN